MLIQATRSLCTRRKNPVYTYHCRNVDDRQRKKRRLDEAPRSLAKISLARKERVAACPGAPLDHGPSRPYVMVSRQRQQDCICWQLRPPFAQIRQSWSKLTLCSSSVLGSDTVLPPTLSETNVTTTPTHCDRYSKRLLSALRRSSHNPTVAALQPSPTARNEIAQDHLPHSL